MSDEPQDYFVEMVTNVSMANNVFRVTLAQQDVNNTARNVVRLLIPANQLAPLLNGLGAAAKEIGTKVGTDQPTPPAPKPAEPKPAAKRKPKPKTKG